MKDFKIAYETPPSTLTGGLNATALGILGAAPDLARKLGVDLDQVTITIRTRGGQTMTVHLERNP